jgi:hypothetical protein
MPNEKHTVSLSFKLMGDEFPHAWFFNRFRIDPLGKSWLVTLALSSELGGILAVNGIVLTSTDMDQNRERTEEYIRKMAEVTGDPGALLSMSPPPARVYPVNHMHLARIDEVAEIGCYRYSINTLVNRMSQTKVTQGSAPKIEPISCYPVVVFRCELSVQVAVLKELYSTYERGR